MLSNDPFNYNTRSCGISEYALIKIDTVLLSWADEIVVMEEDMIPTVRTQLQKCLFRNIPIKNLDIPDIYEFRDGELIELIKTKYKVL